MKYLLAAIGLVSTLTLTQCEKASEGAAKIEGKADMSFAKNTFEGLARGDSTVVDKIDWATLSSMGQNVGAGYSQLPSETQRRNFETAFVTQFASEFRKAGGTPDQFTNWRVSHHDDLKTEVAADSGSGTVTITVTERDGKERVSGLDFIRP